MKKQLSIVAALLLAVGLVSGCRGGEQVEQVELPETAKAAEVNKYKPVIDKWVAADAENPPPKGAVLFIGSSSIRLWKSLPEDFPQYDVINRGFGGSRFEDANLFIDKIVTPYKPRAIVVFEGSNDIAGGKSAEEVFADYKMFVKRVRAGEAGKRKAPIFFIGITPTESRWKHWPAMKQVNGWVREYTEAHDGLYYIDTPTPILATSPEAGGPPARELFRNDLLHLSAEGYALWTRVVTPELEAVVKPTKAKAAAE